MHLFPVIVALNDLDPKLNTQAMWLKVVYGSSFLELAKNVSDSTLYAKSVQLMGNKENADIETLR